MATPYQEIYDLFLQKINDQEFLSLPDEDIEQFCFKYLKTSITKFKKCNQDLKDRDDTLLQFNVDLLDEEKEILSIIMIEQWISPQIYNIMNLKQFMGDREFKYYSQANHLDKLMMLKDTLQSDSEREVTNYTYEQSDLSELV